jgi:hypothetical protein
VTWIVPNNLQRLNGVQGMEEYSLDLNELSQICEQSLIQRSKHSLARTWLQRWKRDSWIKHLFGRILKPSHANSFAEKWTASLPDIPASHSVQRESDKVQTISATSGHISERQLGLFDQDIASLKMSKDTSRLDSPQSSATWKKMVTEQRGEYSQRLKSAHLTRESGCLSWPTAASRDHKDTPGMSKERDGRELGRIDQLPRAVYHYGQQDQVNHSTNGNRQESWQTIEARNNKGYHKQKNGSKVLKLGSQVGCGKLNPRWVETLMGLPIGWTMPSCTKPVTIEPMNCDCSETESCQQQPNEHGVCCINA